MDVQRIIQTLKQKYPDKTIVLTPDNNPTEIVAKLESTKNHPEKSIALAIVGKSKPHLHKITTETYEAVEGTLVVDVDGTKHILKEGEKSRSILARSIMFKVMSLVFDLFQSRLDFGRPYYRQ